jgi:hypothetical protein
MIKINIAFILMYSAGVMPVEKYCGVEVYDEDIRVFYSNTGDLVVDWFLAIKYYVDNKSKKEISYAIETLRYLETHSREYTTAALGCNDNGFKLEINSPHTKYVLFYVLRADNVYTWDYLKNFCLNR